MPARLFAHIPRLLLGLALLLPLSSCSPVGPDFQPPQPQLPQRWTGAEDLQPPVASAADSWWRLFVDPLLHQLIAEAEEASFDMHRAEARVREARAQRVIAASQGSLGAAAAANSARRSDNVAGGSQDLFELGFDARWELDLFGATRRATEAAEAGLEASRAELQHVLVSLRAEVARVYIELRGAQRRLATATNLLAIKGETVATVRGRLELGFDTRLDLHQALTEEKLTRASLPALERNIRQAMHQMAILLGQPPAALVDRLSLASGTLYLPQTIAMELPSELLRRRPDIRAAEMRLAEATASIGVAVADLFPRFSLGGLLGLQSTELSTLLSGASRYWSIGPSLSLALFDRDSRHARVDVSTARRDQLLFDYQQTVLEALGEVENGLIAFSQEQRARGFLVEAVAEAKAAADMARGRYQAGLSDVFPVLQAERTLQGAEEQLIDSEQRLALALVLVYKAMGGDTAPGMRHEESPPQPPATASP